MLLADYQKYCMSFNGVTEEFPFDDVTLVYKVKGKIFSLCNIEEFKSVSLKCDPDDAMAQREAFKAVIPGYHLNKKHWNTIKLGEDVDDDRLREWTADSWELAARGLAKKVRKELGL